MTNIYGQPEKLDLKRELFSIGVKALEDAGWTVERAKGSGKSSVRRIKKGGESKLVSIRTTQDRWIAFPRLDGDKGWKTLDEVDAVVPVSVDDENNPKFAKVHLIDGVEMRARFDRAYAARKQAGRKMTIGRGVWVSLYRPEANDPVTDVGAGAGLKFPAFATVPLFSEPSAPEPEKMPVSRPVSQEASSTDEAPLSIAEAKRRLAKTFGVDPAQIKISVEA